VDSSGRQKLPRYSIRRLASVGIAQKMKVNDNVTKFTSNPREPLSRKTFRDLTFRAIALLIPTTWISLYNLSD
jgi:hypothetical protein